MLDWPRARPDAYLRVAQPLLLPRSIIMLQELDISQVIAALEDEQTLIVSRTQLAAFPSVARRRGRQRARTIDAVGGVLLALGGTFLAVLATTTPAVPEARIFGCVLAGLSTLVAGALMFARALRPS